MLSFFDIAIFAVKASEPGESNLLIWGVSSQIKKISEYFSQNKEKLTEKNFHVPSARKFDLN